LKYNSFLVSSLNHDAGETYVRHNRKYPFFPNLSPDPGKELCDRFVGGRLSSDGGLLLLHEFKPDLGPANVLVSLLRV